MRLKKRGLWDNPYVKCLNSGEVNKIELHQVFIFKKNQLWTKHALIFDNGTWAKPIETISKEEAEKQLNKIITEM